MSLDSAQDRSTKDRSTTDPLGSLESLEALGAYLRQAREDKGVTLSEASHDTFIRTQYLEALETGQLDKLPEAVYIRGFLKRYAEYLGLEGNQVVDYTLPLLQELDHERVSPDLGDKSPNPSVSFALQPLHLWVVYVALIVGAVGALAAFLEPGRFPTLDLEIGQWFSWAQSQPVTEPLPTPTPTLTPTPTPQPTPTPGDGKPVQVKIQVIERASWLRAVADGQTVFEGTLQPGTERNWSAEQSVTLRAGNAGSVSVTFNSEDLGVMGQFGEVKEQVFKTP